MNITFPKLFKKSYAIQPKKPAINPHVHWVYLLRGFLIIAGLLIVFSFYLLYKIKNEELFQTKQKLGDEPSLVQENLLRSVTETFDKKAEKAEELKSEGLPYSDPSI